MGERFNGHHTSIEDTPCLINDAGRHLLPLLSMIPTFNYRLHTNTIVMMPYYDIDRPLTGDEMEEIDELYEKVNRLSIIKNFDRRTSDNVYFETGGISLDVWPETWLINMR